LALPAISENLPANRKLQGDPARETTSRLNVIVHDGTVELWGVVRSRAEKQAIRLAAELTSGVRAVNDNLIVESVATVQLAIA
jgi:osmotically-inducible protein OsmY